MSKRYVDNAYNRGVGRVGKPVGSHVISRESGGGSSSSSSYSSSRSSSDSVLVSGYTRSDGTYVAPYTRSTPGSGASTSKSGSSGSVLVSGYTRSDGTYVAPYTRSTPGSGASTSKSSSSGNTVKVSGYTRADGTEVSSYTRKAPQKSDGVYVDNAYNRKLNRVGKCIGSHVVSQKPTAKTVVASYSIGEVQDILKGLAISDESQQAYQYGYDYLQQREVEERWSRSGIKLSTSVCRGADLNTSHFKVIPYAELKLEKEIGRGGFGVVIAGLWQRTPIAFKKLHYSQMSKKRLDSFLSEVTILASLDHPHIVQLFGAVAEEGNIGIVMEYLSRSLFKAIFVDESAFTDDKKMEIIGQTVDVLVYLHNHKIVHCDIKSENILLDSEDRVKLGDFGLSTVKNATQTTQSVRQAGQGTPRYAAPEILRGDLLSKSELFPTDIYSLAIVVFEVITEEEPFDGLNLKQLERHVGNGSTRPTSEVTAINLSVKSLLSKCWDNLPHKRPNAGEFQDEWKSLRGTMKKLTM